MFLGIEIGGTKLQLGLGRGDGQLVGLWRGRVDAAAGGAGIRKEIVRAVPELIERAAVQRRDLRGIGVGFGGPTDDATQSVIKSHHIEGWHGFPLAAWLKELFGLSTVICNDADVACLAEALHGAGKGFSPVFYMTVGTGIGGGLVIDGEIYRGCGRGAMEVGHLLVNCRTECEGKEVEQHPAIRTPEPAILESFAAGWGIEARAKRDYRFDSLRNELGHDVTVKDLAAAARTGNPAAVECLDVAISALTEGIQQVIKLVCPRKIVIGGGVSLTGDELFFGPLRKKLAANEFPPFAGLTEVTPAALGEEVVIHGALALARMNLGKIQSA
jgi:glucokinase